MAEQNQPLAEAAYPSVQATFIGFGAILMWALLALFTAMSSALPPFQLTALSFSIGGFIGLVWIIKTGQWSALWQPWPVWMIGVAGLFGYHFFYFTALRSAPPVEASLIAYLWPLLIVIFSALLPGERLRWFHITGAIMGLAGTSLIIMDGQTISLEIRYGFGYAMAFGCALIWSGYSVMLRRFCAVPSSFVAATCLCTAFLSGLGHFIWEETVWPASPLSWAGVIGLGLFPVGLAFYFWDYAIKHGHIQIIGVASYAAPLLSTLILILAGFARPAATLFLACALIVGGALAAAQELLFKRTRPTA